MNSVASCAGLVFLAAVFAARAQAPAETAPLAVPAAPPSEPAAAAPDAPRLAPDRSMPPAELEAFVDATVRLAMDQAHIAGATVSIVQDGAVVLAKGYGFASFDPVRRVDPATTLFRIGSISKTFTWIEIMRAVEAGKLSLDAPVNDHLPADLQIPPAGYQPIRVRDLLTHAAGFEDRALGTLFTDDAARLVPLRESLVRNRPRRVREPGEVSSYSNYGAALAGAIVAEIEGEAWQDLIERDILSPLALTHVTGREPYAARPDLPAPLRADLARDLSEPFRWNGVAHEKRSFEYLTQIAPAGAMSASAVDMARYMLLLLGDGTLDGVTVFGPSAAQAFRTPLTRLPREVGALDAGFFETPLPGGFRGYGHGGATLSFFSAMTVVPSLRLGIFVSTNTEGGAQLSDPFAARVVERFYAPPRVPPAKGGSPELAKTLAAYAGDYLTTRRRYSGLEGFLLRTQAVMTVRVSPDGYLVVSANGPPQRFVPGDRPDEFRNAVTGASPEAILFEREGGRPSRVVLIPVAFERTTWLYTRSTLGLAAALALLAAVGIVIGASLRLARKPAASAGQRLAGRVQLGAAVLWLVSALALGVLASSASDTAKLFFGWPELSVLAMSGAALAASVLTLVSALFLPAAWRGALAGPREAAGWSTWRKLRYTLALAIFAWLAILLGAWGALAPWQY